MSKAEQYRTILRSLDNWDVFLLKESGLPGPRGNLELAQIVADEGNAELFDRYLCYNAVQAPVNSPYEFLAFCGAVGLGRLLAEGQTKQLPRIRVCASDSRWRMREGVAMALQRLGDQDMDVLIKAMEDWSRGNLYEQRAAAAALCEPRLLREPKQVRRVLKLLDRITTSTKKAQERKREDFQALRKGLGYCWSVAIVAAPAEGKRALEKWLSSTDKDIVWIVRENLKKDRLKRMDAAWVKSAQARMGD